MRYKRWRDILEIDKVPLSSIVGAIETRVTSTLNAIGLLDQLYGRDEVGIIDRARVVRFPHAVTGSMRHNGAPATEAASMFRLCEPAEIYSVMVKLAIEDDGGDVRGARRTAVR